MASNFFGEIFRITTFGESHGVAVGVVVDGCPAGLPLCREEIDAELLLRRPGTNAYVSPRKEMDEVEILSGVFEGKTTGTPIAMMIRNRDCDGSSYEEIKNLYRPGHANFSYLSKYGIFDYRGGGRASARETAVRVAAGAIAKKLLSYFEIDCVSFLSEVGGIASEFSGVPLDELRRKSRGSSIFCPDEAAERKIKEKLEEIRQEGDSLGGIVATRAKVPAGLGDPVYGKLEARLASAMLSLPASKGFEIGSGFAGARQKGSEHNDLIDLDDKEKLYFITNHSGGVLGGISTGAQLYFRVAFKPTSSIRKEQSSVSLQGEKRVFQLSASARHDPCIAIRAVPVVEAMTALVLVDAYLANQSCRVV